MDMYGSLDAPKVEIISKSEKSSKAKIEGIIGGLQQINKTIKKVQTVRGVTNCIDYSSNNETKKTFITVSEKGSEAYSINRNWEGEALLFWKNVDGSIMINGEKYMVYRLSKDEYEELKKRTQSTGKASQKEKDCWGEKSFKNQSDFESYFK